MQLFHGFEENIINNYPIKRDTFFNVGGIADSLFEPRSIEELISFIKSFSLNNVFVLGACSNVLIRDSGIRGVVTRLNNISDIIDSRDKIIVEAGCRNSKLANWMMKHGFSGGEFLAGIPGTVGAGVIMNAGCFGQDFSQIVEDITIVDNNANQVLLNNGEIKFSYRNSLIPKNSIITKVSFKKIKGEREEIKTSINTLLKKKRFSQPCGFTCGSTFKNGENYKAGELIEKCGLKGYRINGAFISEKHANFIINDGTATAKDIEDLMNFMQKSVYNKFGILMDLEIRILGEK